MAAILRIPYLSLDKRRSDLPIAIKIVDPPALNLNGIGQVFAFRRGSRRLLLIPLHPSSSYNDVELQRLEERYRDALMGSSRLASLKALFTAVTTGTVRIEQNATPGDSSTMPATIIRPLFGYEIDDLAADAFHYYQAKLCDASKVVGDHAGLASSARAGAHVNHPKLVIVIRMSLNRGRISATFIVLLVVGIVLGIVVALCSRRADIGIALSGAVFTLSSCLQVLTIWHQE